MFRTITTGAVGLCLVASLVACNNDNIDTDTEARWAYLGFDRAIDRAINLGFAGFNAASSANIDAQDDVGDVDGSMTVTGQVDQGASDNKEMRLYVDVAAYDDGPFDDVNTEEVEELTVVYDTDSADLPYLEMSLRNVPDGTFTGMLTGTFLVSGDLDASADFSLALAGGIMEDPNSAGDVVREPGTLTITGTVTSSDGTYNVDVMR